MTYEYTQPLEQKLAPRPQLLNECGMLRLTSARLTSLRPVSDRRASIDGTVNTFSFPCETLHGPWHYPSTSYCTVNAST